MISARDKVGLLLAPSRQRVRPLTRAAQLERLLAARDHTAVDNAGDHRRQLAARRREHRLVEEREPVRDALQLDQRETLRVNREREEVCVAKALTDRGGLARRRVDGLVVAARLVLHRERHQQVALLDAFAALALDEPARAPEPAGGAADLAGKCEVDTDEEGAA